MPRLTAVQRSRVRGSLVVYLERMGLPADEAVEAVTSGSPSMADAVGRRIARMPSYAATRAVSADMFNLAVAEWIARKAGVRRDTAPADPAAAAN